MAVLLVILGLIGCIWLIGRVRGTAPPSSLAVQMSCTPKQLDMASTLTVTLPSSHGTDIAIVDPDGEYYFLAFSTVGRPSGLLPPVNKEMLDSGAPLKLWPATSIGIPWDKDTIVPERIFVKEGVYTILVSDALEVETPKLDAWCEVEMRARKSGPNVGSTAK